MDKRTITGIIIGIFVQFVSILLLINYFSSNLEMKVGIFEFLESSLKSKTFLKVGAIASIPNVAIFFWQINKNKVRFSRGIQYVLIAFVLALIVLKFL